MKKLIKNVSKFLLPLLFGGYIFWLVYHKLDIQEISGILKRGIHYEWIVLSLLFNVLANVIRGYRWRLQFAPLNVHPSLKDLINSVFGNYAVNLLLPRLGEVWRCGFIARKTLLPFTKVLGTIVSERVVDVIAIALICLITFFLQMKVFLSFFISHPEIRQHLDNLLSSYWVYGILTALLILFGLLYYYCKRFAWFKRIHNLFIHLWAGIRTILEMEGKVKFLFQTFLIWLCYFLGFYVALFAFEFSSTLGLMPGLTMFVMGSIGIIVPVQGGIGPWHFMIISTMMLYGVSNTQAGAFALVVHGAQTLLTAILGIYTYIIINMDRIKKKRKTDLSNSN